MQELMRSFNNFATSLCLKYMRILHTKQKPHQEQIKPTTTSYIYRAMKFLPKPNVKTPLVRYTGVAKLENPKHPQELPPPFSPPRPIVSQCSSELSPSARLIDHLLQPLAQAQVYPDYLHNSTSLSLILQDLSAPDDTILVTVDVESLYPSIPPSEFPGNNLQ